MTTNGKNEREPEYDETATERPRSQSVRETWWISNKTEVWKRTLPTTSGAYERSTPSEENPKEIASVTGIVYCTTRQTDPRG